MVMINRLLPFFLIVLAQPARTQNHTDTTLIVLRDTVHFDSDKFRIRPADSMVLKSYADTLKNFKNFTILVSGHTDSDGSDAYNDVLSQNRVKAVQDLLSRYGVNAADIQTSYFGEKRPVAENAHAAGKQKNRRATIELAVTYKMFLMQGIVVDDDTDIPIPGATVILHSKYSRDTTKTNRKGMFEIDAPMGAVVGLDGNAPGYFYRSTMFRAHPKMEYDTVEIRLPRMRQGKTFKMTKFYFVGNKAILLPVSDPELHKLLRVMRSNPQTCVEIVGHVNYPKRPPVEKHTFEFNLSVARSKLIYSYLAENGIDENRMFYTGRGNWNMVYPNALREEDMQINRRVEIIVRECSVVEKSENEMLDDWSWDFYK